MKFEMTFLIKNKIEKKKLVNFGPSASWVKQSCHLLDYRLSLFLFCWGWGGCLKSRCTSCFVIIIKPNMFTSVVKWVIRSLFKK